MARYKHVDTNPRFLPIDLARQLLPGTLEHAIDLSQFDARFRNDETGRARSESSLIEIGFTSQPTACCPTLEKRH
jgi:hypothetical protein